MTNDQRMKEIEATVTRIEEMLTRSLTPSGLMDDDGTRLVDRVIDIAAMLAKMAKPAVWQYDADHGADEEKAERIKKLSESLENNSVLIVPTEVPATAGQVMELKAMVQRLIDEVTRPSTFVPSCSIDGKEVVCDGHPVTADGAGASPPHGKKRKH